MFFNFSKQQLLFSLSYFSFLTLIAIKHIIYFMYLLYFLSLSLTRTQVPQGEGFLFALFTVISPMSRAVSGVQDTVTFDKMLLNNGWYEIYWAFLYILEHISANFSCKGIDSKYFRPKGQHMIDVTYTFL